MGNNKTNRMINTDKYKKYFCEAMMKSKELKKIKKNQKYQKMIIGKENRNRCIKNQSNNSENDTITVETLNKTLSNHMFENIEKNKDREKHGHRFSHCYEDWCYSIKYGPKPYETLRSFIPVPDVKTLKRREEESIELIRNGIDINGDTISLVNLFLCGENTVHEKIQCLLSIDAIEIALFKKVDVIIKNLIIFYLIPFNSIQKPLCVKVLKHHNGKVNHDTLQIINSKISEIQADESPVSLQYISTDGNSGYNPEYKKEFKLIYLSISEKGIEEITEFIRDL